jgi:PAS domain S-box-containing protein
MTEAADKKRVIAKKTRWLLFEEIELDHWSLWVRIGLAMGFIILCTFIHFSERLFFNLYLVQVLAAITVVSYSVAYSIFSNKNRVKIYIVFMLIFFDVAIVTLLGASATILQAPSSLLSLDSFSAYIIVILFNGLQNKKRLPLLCGVVSLAGFIVLYKSNVYHYTAFEGTYDFLSRAALIVSATALAMIIAHRNFFIMKKVISSEIRYQKLVHRLPEMLFTLDAKGMIIWTSRASGAILGIEAKEMPNRMLRDFLKKPETLKLDRSEFKATLQLNDTGKNGIKFVDCFIQPIKEEGKEPVFEGILTDVTDREIAVFQREEMVKRLYQYQKMESLGTLAAGMAHDFNNILQTVSDIVVRASIETAETTTKKYMSTISEDLIDAKFLISELLALGRKQPLDFKPIHVQAFFASVIPQLSKQLGKGSTINAIMPDKPLWIYGDADYFKRVIQNIVDNADDAMPGGGEITIECSLQKYTGKSNMAVIRIADNGIGIPTDLLGRVFDPFFTTKKPGKGTGLGLALVQRIVTLHNGTVVIEKTDRTGTTFRIEIPEKVYEENDLDTKEILNRRTTRVLIMDDDPKIRSILKFFLSEFKYPLCEASDIDDGVRELDKYVQECDLVIMDWNLSADDPHHVIRSLRAIKPGLIVIVVSGYPPRPESIQAMNIFKWITKPYDKNQLDLEIQKALYYNKKL